jgi:hypothetical protein
MSPFQISYNFEDFLLPLDAFTQISNVNILMMRKFLIVRKNISNPVTFEISNTNNG